jgi:DNA-binding beta-propeller fold protein YncE
MQRHTDRRPHFAWSCLGLAALVAACQVAPGRTSAKAPRALPSGPAGLPSGEEASRGLGTARQVVDLVGELRLLTNGRGGIISNHGGGLISDQGGGLVSNHGAGLVSNHGGGLLANHGAGWRLAQAEAGASESFLADAELRFLDAQGRAILDDQGRPLATSSDRQGVFRFRGELPAEALVAQVKLWQGGQLLAMLVPDPAASGSARLLSLSTASSLAAAYVLDEYVQGRPQVYAKLPASEVKALYGEAEAAWLERGPGFRPSYQREELRQSLGSLRAQDPRLNGRLERIQALLLAGQASLGEGLPATQVALSAPLGALPWPNGSLAIVELIGGRLRVVDAQGRLSTQELQPAGGLRPVALRSVGQGLKGDGLLVDRLGRRVYRLKPGGALSLIAGNGDEGTEGLPGPATQRPMQFVASASEAPDGRVFITEVGDQAVAKGRLLALSPQGELSALPLPAELEDARVLGRKLEAVCALPDGALAMLAQWGEGDQGSPITQVALWWRTAQGEWLPPQSLGKVPVENAALLADGPGQVILAMSGQHQVWRRRQDGGQEVVAGTGTAGLGADGSLATECALNAPSGLSRGAAGQLLIADTGNGLMREVDAQGRIRTLAGTSALTQSGEALAVSMNGPGGLAVDAQGQVLVTELFSSTIKVLKGDRLELYAGRGKGPGGDGGPALQAQFNSPYALAPGPLGLLVADGGNYRVRLIAPDGQVRTLAGNGKREGPAQDGVDPLKMGLLRPFGVAQAPDGSVAWSDNERHVVWGLKPGATTVEAIAGTGVQGDGGDGGPAKAARLSLPLGLAYGPDGALYIADAGNLRVRRVLPDGRIETFAGAPLAELLPRLKGEAELLDPDGTERLQAALYGPGVLAFDAKGQLYIGEAGTAQLEQLAGSLLTLLVPKGSTQVASRIRQVDATGRVHTIAGPGGRVLAASAGDDALGAPAGLAFDRQGRLLIADGTRNQLKVVPPSALP